MDSSPRSWKSGEGCVSDGSMSSLCGRETHELVGCSPCPRSGSAKRAVRSSSKTAAPHYTLWSPGLGPLSLFQYRVNRSSSIVWTWTSFGTLGCPVGSWGSVGYNPNIHHLKEGEIIHLQNIDPKLRPGTSTRRSSMKWWISSSCLPFWSNGSCVARPSAHGGVISLWLFGK